MGMLAVWFSDAGDAQLSTCVDAGWHVVLHRQSAGTPGLLVRHIDLLRACVAAERSRRPFAIRAWVVLPEHMHWMWTLPVGDADFPTRWRRIKTDFSRALACTERRSAVRVSRGERGVWQPA
jgi:putative transposase